MLDVLFTDAEILTMCDEKPALKGCVGVRGGYIAYVGEALPKEPALRTIDCKGKILMPGLVNLHAHTAMCILRGYADDYALEDWLYKKVFPVEARLDRRAVLAGLRLGFAEMLSTGTTSVSDMYMFEPDAAELALSVGIRASLCNALLTVGGFDPQHDRAVQETHVLAKRYHGAGSGRIRAEVGIHAEYTTQPEVWAFACRMADEYGLGIQVHLSETQSEHDACMARYGKTPAAVLDEHGVFSRRAVAAHCVALSEADMELLAKRRVSVAHCPVSNLKLASGVANVAKMQEYGINVGLGTDGCCSNNTHDLFEEIKLAALLAKGVTRDPKALSAYDALKLATVNGAKAQGRESEIGKIKEGMQADIILLIMDKPSNRPRYDPAGAVVYSASGASNVELTMVQGRILYEGGKFTTLDIEEAYAEVEAYAKPLVLGQILP